jgi:hypothetical protein
MGIKVRTYGTGGQHALCPVPHPHYDKEGDQMTAKKTPKVEEVTFPLNDVPYEMLRLAWPFKTTKEHELIRKWARKQTKVRRISFL